MANTFVVECPDALQKSLAAFVDVHATEFKFNDKCLKAPRNGRLSSVVSCTGIRCSVLEGLFAACRNRGLKVQAFKVGPGEAPSKHHC